MRIARSTINDKYVQPLKLRISERLVVCGNVDYNSILLRNTHRRKQDDIDVALHMKFDSENFDGAQVISYLTKDNENPISVSWCEFKIYTVSSDDLWSETLEDTSLATIVGNKCIGIIPQSTISKVLEGEYTLGVLATLSRLGKTYKQKSYFNHLGSFDSIIRLRNKIKFIEITKKDFGVP